MEVNYTMKATKWLSVVLVLLISLVALQTVYAVAPFVNVTEVEVNDDVVREVSANFVREFDRNQEIEVHVEFTANETVDNVQVEAEIFGHRFKDKLSDVTHAFDVVAGVSYAKDLKIRLPYRLEPADYRLRVRVAGRDTETVEKAYLLKLEAEQDAMMIDDVVFTPANSVEAGRAVLATVRVRNIGKDDDNKGIKVSVGIPELGVSDTSYVDELESDDATSTEELYFRVPSCARPGRYNVVTKITFDFGDETVERQDALEVVAGGSCEQSGAGDNTQSNERTVLTVGPSTQDVAAGQAGAVYPLTIQNAGRTAKTYTVSVEGVDSFGTVRLDPSNVLVLQPGEAKAAYVFVSAREGTAAGVKPFSVTVSANGETLRQFVLNANVVAPQQSEQPTESDTLQTALKVGLVVLVVVVVVLGLVVAFTKMKGKDNEVGSQTYY